MPSSSRNEVLLVRYPYSDLTNSKVRPAIVVGRGRAGDLFIVPLTSRTTGLTIGEFVLAHSQSAGLKVVSAVRRGIFTVQQSLVLKSLGRLSSLDATRLDQSLREWLELV